MFAIFFLGSALCFAFSAWFHTGLAHSEKVRSMADPVREGDDAVGRS